MPNKVIRVQNRELKLHSSTTIPDHRSPQVICSEPFDYCSLWLTQKHKKDALFYWEQARHFFEASKSLPKISAPLTSYYCFLNATKALLEFRKENYSDAHGLKGGAKGVQTSLSNEYIQMKGAGVLPALARLLNEPVEVDVEVTLKDMLWHLPFLHRAYCLSFKSDTELFLPLENCRFVKKHNSTESWFESEIDSKYFNSHTRDQLSKGFEICEYEGKRWLRHKKRFSWAGNKVNDSIIKFDNNHRRIRKSVVPIYSLENKWYLKKSVAGSDAIKNSQLVLMFATMHRLSELSRYDPMKLHRHFGVTRNWLLSQFIENAPIEFLYGIASEMTGMEFINSDNKR